MTDIEFIEYVLDRSIQFKTNAGQVELVEKAKRLLRNITIRPPVTDPEIREMMKFQYAENTKPKSIICDQKDYHKYAHLIDQGYTITCYPLPARTK